MRCTHHQTEPQKHDTKNALLLDEGPLVVSEFHSMHKFMPKKMTKQSRLHLNA